MKKRSIYLELFLLYILFLVIAIFVKGVGKNDTVELLLSVATFCFAIFLGFSIANRHKRLSGIKETLRNNDAQVLTMYYSAKSFGKNVLDTCRKMIDNYITQTIDHKLVDYDKTTPSLIELYSFILNLNPRNEKEGDAKGEMLSSVRELIQNQKKIIHFTKDKMAFFEWFSIVALLLIMLFSLYSMSSNTLISYIFLPIVSVALVLMLLVLRDLNNLTWQEYNWIWDPLEDMFREIDLLPYYPKDLFDANRLKDKQISHLEKYRIATYPHPYPDMTGKKVKVVSRK